MARISEVIIEQVRSTADVIEVISRYVELKKRGRNYFGLCPFHGEKTPSFSVNSERQIYKCFGCGVGGGVINFIMEIEGLEFINAIKFLANQYSIEIELGSIVGKTKDIKTELFDIHNKTSNIFFKNFNTEEGKSALAHIESRGISRNMIKKFKLGYSLKQKNALLSIFREDGIKGDIMKQSGLFIDTKSGYIDRFNGRIMFSIYNSSGNIIGFAGRVYKTNDSAKYINSPETPIYNKSKILYGLHETKQNIREIKSVIVVEGYLDFLQLYQSGIHNIVAVSGTAFTSQHALQLKRFCNTVYLAYDGDSAGIAASIRAGYVLLQSGLSVYIINIPAGLDPDDWVKENGNKPFLDAVLNSEKLLPFHYKNYKGDINITSDKANFVNDVIIELIQISNPVDRELYGKELSELVGVTPDSIFQLLNNMLQKHNYRKKYKKTNQDIIANNYDKKQTLEYDLIRLCFSKEKSIREYLFNNVKPEWIVTNSTQKFYEKIYIHLHSEFPPEVDFIINELKDDKLCAELANLVFDLEKLNPTLKSAKDCVTRLEENHINVLLQNLRIELKGAESNRQDLLPIMHKIEELQKRKKKILSKKFNE